MRRCILRQKGNRVGKREVEEEEEKEEEEEEEEEEKEEEDDGGIRRSHRTSSCPQRTCPRWSRCNASRGRERKRRFFRLVEEDYISLSFGFCLFVWPVRTCSCI